MSLEEGEVDAAGLEPRALLGVDDGYDVVDPIAAGQLPDCGDEGLRRVDRIDPAFGADRAGEEDREEPGAGADIRDPHPHMGAGRVDDAETLVEDLPAGGSKTSTAAAGGMPP